MPNKIKFMGYFEIVIGLIGLGTSLATYFEILPFSNFLFSLNIGLVFLVVYFGFHITLGISLIREWKYALSIECVFAMLRMGTGFIMFIWGLWIIYLFISNKEIREQSGIPVSSSP